MIKSVLRKLLAYSMAGAISMATFVASTPITSFAEESEAVVTKSFTIDEVIYNTSLTSKKATLGSQSSVSFDLNSDSAVYISDIVPSYDGYHIERADYKKGYSNYVGIDYFYLKPYTVKATGETDYSVYFHYTGANGNSDLTQAASHSKGTGLYVHYALNNFVVSYIADEDVTNVPADSNEYNIENADVITISSEVPVKEGYTFAGWILEETGALYQPGETISIADLKNEAVNLTASFTENPKASVNVNTEVVKSWDDQVQLNVTVTNVSDVVYKNWKISVDFGGIISQIWNADVVSEENGVYVISHPSWKTDLEAGESYTFGLIATNSNYETVEMNNATVVSKETTVDAENYEFTLGKSEWSYGYNGDIVITNKTDSAFEGWTVEFDYADDITNIWNAIIVSHEGNHYVIENAGHNGTIADQSSVSFGFSATPAESAEFSNASAENVVLTVME